VSTPLSTPRVIPSTIVSPAHVHRWRGTSAARMVLVIILGALALSGCLARAVKEGGSELASTGMEASTQLARYYDALARDTIDSYELNAFREGTLGISSSDAQARRDKTLGDNLTALQARAALALQLKGVYAALGALADSTAPAATRSAAEGVVGAVLTLRKSPLADPASGAVKSVVGMIAEDVLAYVQAREVVSAAELARKTEAALRALFEDERETYASISAFRAEKAGVVVAGMLTRNEVLPWPLVDRVLVPYGLVLANAKAVPTDAGTRTGFEHLAAARTRRLAVASGEATDAMGGTLAGLAKAHAEFPARSASLDDAIAFLGRTRAYLDLVRTYHGQ